MSEKKSPEGSLKNRLVQRYRNKSFVFYDFLILAAAIVVFSLVWLGLTRASNVAVFGEFYSEGFSATYRLEGSAARALGSSWLEIETVEVNGDTAVLEITAEGMKKRLTVDRKIAKVTDGEQTGLPLVFYYDIVREPGQTSKTFGSDREPAFSTAFTGLKGDVSARVKESNPDNLVMWYHESDDRSYGPQFSWELDLYDGTGKKVGTIVNDVTSGVLLDARFYQDGWGAMNLERTNYPTGLNRWAIFYGLNSILLFWGLFHLLRCRKHREEWEAQWSYFPLNFVGISRFYIRLMAFTTFGFLGMGVLTGDPYVLLVSDLIGLALMIYAVGVFAFPVVFKFIPWIAAFGVFAGGRPMDYVQYPFGVLLYLTAVVMFELHRYLCHKEKQKLGLSTGLAPEIAGSADNGPAN